MQGFAQRLKQERELHLWSQEQVAEMIGTTAPSVSRWEHGNTFPGLHYLQGINAARADLMAILLTGLPSGLIQGFQNFTGNTQADMLRLNMAIPPSNNPNIYGILGGDLAGFPNGRRFLDDVFTIELRAIAGVTYPLIDPSYVPDAAASQVTDGLTPSNIKNPYLTSFPYLGVPYDGFDYPGM